MGLLSLASLNITVKSFETWKKIHKAQNLNENDKTNWYEIDEWHS